MGAAGVVDFCGLRIGGISGIYKHHDYELGRHEKPPYDRSSLRSVYHVRNLDIYRMLSLSKKKSQKFHALDVMVSHDWPQGIEQHGNTDELLRRKPYFRSEIEQNCLGSPANNELLMALKPRWWFAAHLHVKFRANFRHSAGNLLGPGTRDKDAETTKGNPGAEEREKLIIPSSTISAETRKRKADEAEASPAEEARIESDGNENDGIITQFMAPDESRQTCTLPDLTDQMTQFLSLDKCLPRRHFMTIVQVPVSDRVESPKLKYDPEWLSILRKTHNLSSRSHQPVVLPTDVATVDENDIEGVQNRLHSLEIPENFVQTVPPIAPGTSVIGVPHSLPPPVPQMGNPQTDALLNMLGLDHMVTVPYKGSSSASTPASTTSVRDENDIDLSDEED